MKALQGWGRATVFREGRVITNAGEQLVTVTLEFERRPRGYAQRVEFRSWRSEDIARAAELKPGAVVKFKGEVDASVMLGAEDRVFANPRITGRIIRIKPPGGAA